MGRRRRGLLDDLTILPWPVGLTVGVLGFLVLRYGIPAWFSGQGGPFARGFAQAIPFSILAWAVLAVCVTAAFVSFLGARRKRQLLDTRTGLDSIAALGWRDFERLVGEAFRRRGYAVEETGLGGADGGIDLVLRRNGKRTLVQCKQWRREKVPVNVVREMYGLLAHHDADEVRIAALGGFTPDAARFADGKPAELIDGRTLLGMIRTAQMSGGVTPQSKQRVDPVNEKGTPSVQPVPECPRCGQQMAKRVNRQSGNAFWGCSMFPRCKGTL